eukprot:5516047-Prymnesium_polylepis.1
MSSRMRQPTFSTSPAASFMGSLAAVSRVAMPPSSTSEATMPSSKLSLGTLPWYRNRPGPAGVGSQM